jgi:hypothetical protein
LNSHRQRTGALVDAQELDSALAAMVHVTCSPPHKKICHFLIGNGRTITHCTSTIKRDTGKDLGTSIGVKDIHKGAVGGACLSVSMNYPGHKS